MNDQTFEQLVCERWENVVRYAQFSCELYNRHDAEDVVQEKLMALWERRGFQGDHGGRAIPEAFLKRCVHNASIDFFRSQRSERERRQGIGPIVRGTCIAPIEIEGASRIPDAEHEDNRKEATEYMTAVMAQYREMEALHALDEHMKALPHALRKLPYPYSKVIHLWMHDVGQEEIGRRLGWHRSKVQRVLKQALKLLRQLMNGDPGPDTPSGGRAGVPGAKPGKKGTTRSKQKGRVKGISSLYRCNKQTHTRGSSLLAQRVGSEVEQCIDFSFTNNTCFSLSNKTKKSICSGLNWKQINERRTCSA